LTDHDRIPTIDLGDFTSGDSERRNHFVQTIGNGLLDCGFIKLEGHDVDPALIRSGYDAFESFFALDEETKKQYAGTEAGARGYTPFGIEHAKDSDKPDLKEFWQVGQDLPEGHPYQAEYADNVWPGEIPAFHQHALEIFRRLENCARLLLESIAEFFELPAGTFSEMIVDGNHVLRIIHYPPLQGEVDPGAFRSAPHEDINLITLLCEATQGGLEILTRENEWIPVEAKSGQIVVDSGDMIARVTNGIVPATTHRVSNPKRAVNESRYSIPFFVHPFSACDLTVMDRFVSEDRTPRFDPITAGEYLQQRLREIGLKG